MIVKTIHRLRERGVNLDRLDEDMPSVATEGPLVGVRVAITGTLWMGREAIVELIQAAGGQFDKSVSNKTNILFIADPNSQSNKAVAARNKGARLVGPEEAQQLLGLA
jgi:NAD-dependent DNA ligase